MHQLTDDVIKWRHFPRHWPFVRGIHRWPVDSPHEGHWHRTSMFSLICSWTNRWTNRRDAGDLNNHRAHYDVIVMISPYHADISCPDLALPTHAVLMSCNKTYQGRCTFDCKEGYVQISGDDVRVCGLDTEWSGTDIVCEGIFLSPNLACTAL